MAQGPKRRLRLQVRATPDAGEGTFEAKVSTYELEYEVGWGWTEQILPGCFEDSIKAHPVIPIFLQHEWTLASLLGDGEPTENDADLTVTGQLYLAEDSSIAKAYRAMQSGALQEWSIGFWAEEITWEKDNPMCDQIVVGDLAEASLCVRGANPDTGTIDLSNRDARGWLMADDEERQREVARLRAKFDVRDLGARRRQRQVAPPRTRAAIAVHHTDTSTGTWDGPAQEANLDNDDGASVYKKAFAWVDPDKDADTKAAYKFIHHFVTDGDVGDASTVACSSGIGVLNGGRGGTTIPDGDIQGVYDHLAAHLKDADVEPPELKSDAQTVLVRIAGLLDGDDALAAVRAALESVLRSDDDEPTTGELAQSIDALIDQVVVLLEADPPDTKGALDILTGADATCDQLLEALGVPDDDDIADSERGRRRDANDPNDDLVGTHFHEHSHDDGTTHSHEHTHNPSVAEHDAEAADVPHTHDHPTGPDEGETGDPADDESSRAIGLRLMATPHGRKLLLAKTGEA